MGSWWKWQVVTSANIENMNVQTSTVGWKGRDWWCSWRNLGTQIHFETFSLVLKKVILLSWREFLKRRRKETFNLIWFTLHPFDEAVYVDSFSFQNFLGYIFLESTNSIGITSSLGSSIPLNPDTILDVLVQRGQFRDTRPPKLDGYCAGRLLGKQCTWIDSSLRTSSKPILAIGHNWPV